MQMVLLRWLLVMGETGSRQKLVIKCFFAEGSPGFELGVVCVNVHKNKVGGRWLKKEQGVLFIAEMEVRRIPGLARCRGVRFLASWKRLA